MGKRRVKPQTEEEIDGMYNDILDFLGGKGIFRGYEIRIGKFSASKCIEKLESAVSQFQKDPSSDNLARLEQVMAKAGFDQAVMEEFKSRYSIVVKEEIQTPIESEEPGGSKAQPIEEPEFRLDMPNINAILEQEEKIKPEASKDPKNDKTAEPQGQEKPNDDKSINDQDDKSTTAEKTVGQKDSESARDDEIKPTAEDVKAIESTQMPLNEKLKAFLKFNKVDLSKFGGEKEQEKIIAELTEAVEACQKEINPASLRMLGQVVIGKIGMSKDAIERLGDIFVPNWRQKPDRDPDRDLATIKEETQRINDEIDELMKQIAERKQKLAELNEKDDDAEPERESGSAEETIGQKADKAMKKHESLATKKSFLSGIVSIQSKTLDFYTDHMITGSYDGLKFILAESVAIAAMTGYAAGKATLKLGKLAFKAGKSIFTAAKGTAKKAKEKADEKRDRKAEQEDKETADAEKSDDSKSKKEKKPPKMTRKEKKDLEKSEESLDIIELAKSTSMEMVKVSRERLEQARVDETLLNNPSKEADLTIIRTGSDEDRDAERSMLSRENRDLVAKVMKNINNLRYVNLYNTLEQSCGLTKEQILELIKTSKVLDNGEIVLGKKAIISVQDIEDAGAYRLFKDAVSLRGIGTVAPEEVLRLAKGINIQNGKISIDGIENLSSNARLIAASISGGECYFDGSEKLQELFKYCANTYELNNQIINESYAVDLHNIAVDLDCQIEMIRSEMIELQNKGVKKTRKERDRRDELTDIAEDKVAMLEDLGVIEVIENESRLTAKITREASRVLSQDLSQDIKKSAELGREFIGPDEQEK